MHKFTILLCGMACFLLGAILSACNGASTSQSAPAAIQAYLRALETKDANQMINLSCAAWESQARLEYDSFAAVKVVLENLSCKESGKDGEDTLVACTGKIIASYGAEDLVIDLQERTYLAVNEGGEWRMCGYR